jgi:hypothetical protein
MNNKVIRKHTEKLVKSGTTLHMLEEFMFIISVGTPTIPTVALAGLPQSLHRNAGILPQFRSHPLTFTAAPIKIFNDRHNII